MVKSARRKSSALPVWLWAEISSRQTWRGWPWLALIFVFLGGVFSLEDLTGSGISGDDAGAFLELDALAVVEDLGRCRGSQEGKDPAKGKGEGCG